MAASIVRPSCTGPMPSVARTSQCIMANCGSVMATRNQLERPEVDAAMRLLSVALPKQTRASRSPNSPKQKGRPLQARAAPHANGGPPTSRRRGGSTGDNAMA